MSSTVCSSLWFWVQKVKDQGHKVIISNFSNPLHICRTDAATKFKFFAQMHYGRLLAVGQKLCRNAAGVTECEIFTPNALSRETWNGISVTLRTTVGPQCDVIQNNFAFRVGLDLHLHIHSKILFLRCADHSSLSGLAFSVNPLLCEFIILLRIS